MQMLIYLVTGLVIGYLVGRRSSGLPEEKKKVETLIEKEKRQKAENMRKILGLLETQTPLTNNHVEQLLGISDATATRYLEELEKEGRVRQVGTTGQAVYYEKI